MTSIREAYEAGITQLEGYNYRLWDYQPSHSHLTVRARHPGHRGDIYIVFHAVEYVQAPMYWDKGDFRLASETERRALAEKIGYPDLASYPLFMADTPKGLVYILGYIEDVFLDNEEFLRYNLSLFEQIRDPYLEPEISEIKDAIRLGEYRRAVDQVVPRLYEKHEKLVQEVLLTSLRTALPEDEYKRISRLVTMSPRAAYVEMMDLAEKGVWHPSEKDKGIAYVWKGLYHIIEKCQ